MIKPKRGRFLNLILQLVVTSIGSVVAFSDEEYELLGLLPALYGARLVYQIASMFNYDTEPAVEGKEFRVEYVGQRHKGLFIGSQVFYFAALTAITNLSGVWSFGTDTKIAYGISMILGLILIVANPRKKQVTFKLSSDDSPNFVTESERKELFRLAEKLKIKKFCVQTSEVSFDDSLTASNIALSVFLLLSILFVSGGFFFTRRIDGVDDVSSWLAALISLGMGFYGVFVFGRMLWAVNQQDASKFILSLDKSFLQAPLDIADFKNLKTKKYQLKDLDQIGFKASWEMETVRDKKYKEYRYELIARTANNESYVVFQFLAAETKNPDAKKFVYLLAQLSAQLAGKSFFATDNEA